MNTNQYLVHAPIGKLMLKFSIPCILSLLVSSLYNIVDQIFIGWGIGYLGNGATNVVFPITVITLALALMIGDSCAAYMSLCQGQQDSEGADQSVGNAVSLTVLLGVLLVLLFWVAEDPILHLFGATENNLAYAQEYFIYIVIGIPFFMFANTINSMIRADGSPKFALISTLVGCLLNVILDPIAIFVLGWGMKGAALATITGQIVTALLAIWYLTHAKTFRLKKEGFRLRARLLRRFLPLGVSSLLTQLSIVVIMVVMNHCMISYGAASKYGSDIPLTVVGIVMKVFQIVVAISVGIAAGAQPIIGYNYGAESFERVKKLYVIMMRAECLVGFIALFCFEFFPLQITHLFGSENALYNEFAVLTFRIFLCTIPLCCVQKATSIFLQALGKPVLSMTLSLLRDFILSVPLTVLLCKGLGVTGALYSAPIADIITFVVLIAIMVPVYRTLNKPSLDRQNTADRISVVNQ